MAGLGCLVIATLMTLWQSVFSGVPDLTEEQLYGLVVTNNPRNDEIVRCSFDEHVLYIQVRRDWAPLGAARFVELVKDGQFDEMALFRGLDNFLVQFGLASTTTQRNKWRGQEMQDDPHNDVPFKRGIMSYAGSGPGSRGCQMFITLTDRKTHLGQEPWEVPFAEVVYGKENLDYIYTKYGDQVNQQEIWRKGYEYLKENFPELTYLKECRMVEAPQIEISKNDL